MKLLEKINILLMSLCLTTTFFLFDTAAQQKIGTVELGEQYVIHSDILNEDRLLMIYTPPLYESSDAEYPVIILTDGNAHFKHTAGLVEYYFQTGKMPPVIIVGIPNTKRTRDLTPPGKDVAERFHDGGEAKNFLHFIQKELMPYVERNYRTSGYRVLIGHSFGGLFALYSFLEVEEYFHAYFSLSPSMWWDDESYIAKTEKLLKERSSLPVYFFTSIGTEGEQMEGSFERFTEVLQDHQPDGFTSVEKHYSAENHGSTPHISLVDGLTMLFDRWNYPGNLAEAKFDDIIDYYKDLSEEIGLDISSPEALMNRAGYQLMNAGKSAEAEKYFLFNIEHYPASANVYDSYGDWLYRYGTKEKAFTYYMKAFEIGQKTNHPYVEAFKENVRKLKKELSSGR